MSEPTARGTTQRTRLRLAFVLLSAALLVPTALLVERALAGAAAEQEARQRAVAERVFDEMERALSALVAREEARPVEAWSEEGELRLRGLPDEPFVVGYFQLEADGRLRVPVPLRDPAVLRAVRGWLARDERELRDADPAALRALGSVDARLQAPGTTVELAESGRPSAPQARADASESAASPAAEGAYRALQSLNRGASERAARQRKLVAPAPFEQAALAKDDEKAKREEADAAVPQRSQAPRMAVDPLVGRLADEHTLLLYRSVFADGAALRQGLVIDVDELEQWLRGLGFEDVPGAVLRFANGSAAAAGPDAASHYRHRFAEPFDRLDASLALPPLPGVAGAGVLYALSALLALTSTAGLFALYRMAALAMAFAERRSNFVAAVTHELRTPVTAIRLYGEMLRDDLVPSEEKRREYYRTISAESERLGRLVDDVLQLARLEQGGRPVPLAAGALGPVVEEALTLLRPRAERAGFALEGRLDPGLPSARFDRDALLQVIGNLVDNALKYAREARERTIEVSGRHDGDDVLLVVRDHGPGVPSGQLPLLFEPFHRGEDERVRTSQGTGLGLALVRRLVERMGGRVEGRNAAGGGFEVRIALPAVAGG